MWSFSFTIPVELGWNSLDSRLLKIVFLGIYGIVVAQQYLRVVKNFRIFSGVGVVKYVYSGVYVKNLPRNRRMSRTKNNDRFSQQVLIERLRLLTYIHGVITLFIVTSILLREPLPVHNNYHIDGSQEFDPTVIQERPQKNAGDPYAPHSLFKIFFILFIT